MTEEQRQAGIKEIEEEIATLKLDGCDCSICSIYQRILDKRLYPALDNLKIGMKESAQ